MMINVGEVWEIMVCRIKDLKKKIYSCMQQQRAEV
jgi:uncharacterized protein with HEPN domain